MTNCHKKNTLEFIARQYEVGFPGASITAVR